MADKKNKLPNPVDDPALQSIIAEIEQLAKEVVGDYKKTPSEICILLYSQYNLFHLSF